MKKEQIPVFKGKTGIKEPKKKWSENWGKNWETVKATIRERISRKPWSTALIIEEGQERWPLQVDWILQKNTDDLLEFHEVIWIRKEVEIDIVESQGTRTWWIHIIAELT